jgi:VanZ family protein
MRKSRFTEEQRSLGVLKEHEAGVRTEDLRRRHGISDFLQMEGPLARAMAWLYAVALVFLTLGSPSVRLETEMFHDLEHLAAFGVSGLLFSIGYRSRRLLVLLAGVGFTAVLEGLQMWAPGRHARWIDLAMNGTGFCIGVGVLFVVSRSASHLARRSRAVSETPRRGPGSVR